MPSLKKQARATLTKEDLYFGKKAKENAKKTKKWVSHDVFWSKLL